MKAVTCSLDLAFKKSVKWITNIYLRSNNITKENKMGGKKSSEKSLLVTYLLWFFFGFFGVHHFYLERDAQAFLWWSTLGGCLGCGWIRDLFCIPRYVAEANGDPDLLQKHVKKVKSNSTPPFSVVRFMGMLMIGYLFASLCQYAIPVEPVLGFDLNFLHVFVPLACAVGVWLVGNLGKEQGTIWWTLAAAYAVHPLSVYMEDETTWFSLMVLASSMAFDNMSKEWRRKPRKKRTMVRRIAILTLCGLVYLSFTSSYLYFNGKLVDSDGEEIPIHEAITHFFTSPWWVDLQQSLYDVYVFAQHHGWYEIWQQIVNLSDPHGEINAYKVLGVDWTTPQSEITSKWRTLSREFHPDKVKDPAKKAEAHDKFMEIQQAYEILSNIKARRKNKNKKSAQET